MPFDPFFKLKKRKPRRHSEESIELQIGRSDFLLGALQRECPFHETNLPHSDASEWRRGWLLEHMLVVQAQQTQEKLFPPWRTRFSRVKQK